jgi:hypothetical protein
MTIFRSDLFSITHDMREAELWQITFGTFLEDSKILSTKVKSLTFQQVPGRKDLHFMNQRKLLATAHCWYTFNSTNLTNFRKKPVIIQNTIKPVLKTTIDQRPHVSNDWAEFCSNKLKLIFEENPPKSQPPLNFCKLSKIFSDSKVFRSNFKLLQIT